VAELAEDCVSLVSAVSVGVVVCSVVLEAASGACAGGVSAFAVLAVCAALARAAW
jgi:hypothetical protein